MGSNIAAASAFRQSNPSPLPSLHPPQSLSPNQSAWPNQQVDFLSDSLCQEAGHTKWTSRQEFWTSTKSLSWMSPLHLAPVPHLNQDTKPGVLNIFRAVRLFEILVKSKDPLSEKCN